jgi:hypothetical protein
MFTLYVDLGLRETKEQGTEVREERNLWNGQIVYSL